MAEAAALAAVVEQAEAEADQQQGALPVALTRQGGARGGAAAAADPGEAPPQEIEPEDPGDEHEIDITARDRVEFVSKLTTC